MDPCVHAEPTRGRVDVRGVAGEEYGPDAVLRDHALVEVEADGPCDVVEVHVTTVSPQRRLELVRLGHLGRALRPAPPQEDGPQHAAAERHRYQRLVGVEIDEDPIVRQPVAAGAAIDLDEVLMIAVAVEREPEALAHRAVGAVAADEEPGLQRLPPVGPLDRELHAVRPGLEPAQGVPPVDRPAELLEPAQQDRLRSRLRNDQRPLLRVGEADQGDRPTVDVDLDEVHRLPGFQAPGPAGRRDGLARVGAVFAGAVALGRYTRVG